MDRFERDGEALWRPNHPNIVNILDTVEEDGKHYLVMGCVSSGSLRDLIDEQSCLPLETVLNIALDLVDDTPAGPLNVLRGTASHRTAELRATRTKIVTRDR